MDSSSLLNQRPILIFQRAAASSKGQIDQPARPEIVLWLLTPTSVSPISSQLPSLLEYRKSLAASLPYMNTHFPNIHMQVRLLRHHFELLVPPCQVQIEVQYRQLY